MAVFMTENYLSLICLQITHDLIVGISLIVFIADFHSFTLELLRWNSILPFHDLPL